MTSTFGQMELKFETMIFLGKPGNIQFMSKPLSKVMTKPLATSQLRMVFVRSLGLLFSYQRFIACSRQDSVLA
jgi:hypothetical protein